MKIDSLVLAASGVLRESEDYQEFFKSALTKFGVDSPAELDDDKKKEFFDYVDKHWKGDKKESNESTDEINEVTVNGDYNKWKAALPRDTSNIDSTKADISVAYRKVNGKDVVIGTYYHKSNHGVLNEELAYEKDLDPKAKIVVKGVQGMKSKPFVKKFANLNAADKWIDSNEGDIEVYQIMNEESDKISEGTTLQESVSSVAVNLFAKAIAKNRNLPEFAAAGQALEDHATKFAGQWLRLQNSSNFAQAFLGSFEEAFDIRAGVGEPSDVPTVPFSKFIVLFGKALHRHASKPEFIKAGEELQNWSMKYHGTYSKVLKSSNMMRDLMNAIAEAQDLRLGYDFSLRESAVYTRKQIVEALTTLIPSVDGNKLISSVLSESVNTVSCNKLKSVLIKSKTLSEASTSALIESLQSKLNEAKFDRITGKSVETLIYVAKELTKLAEKVGRGEDFDLKRFDGYLRFLGEIRKTVKSFNSKDELTPQYIFEAKRPLQIGDEVWLLSKEAIGKVHKLEGTTGLKVKLGDSTIVSAKLFEVRRLDESEMLAEAKILSPNRLKIGKSYTFEDEIGQKFKATVKGIRNKSNGVFEVDYIYDDDSYAKKGGKDTFVIGGDAEGAIYEETITEAAKPEFKIGSRVKVLHGGNKNKIGRVVDWDEADEDDEFDENGISYHVKLPDGKTIYLDAEDITLA